MIHVITDRVGKSHPVEIVGLRVVKGKVGPGDRFLNMLSLEKGVVEWLPVPSRRDAVNYSVVQR